ncbi:hypothetical protein AB3S75_001842 [Citrus x aurantiifolia]
MTGIIISTLQVNLRPAKGMSMSHVKQAGRQDLPKATSVLEEVTDKQTWPAHLVTVGSSRNSFLNILYCI